MRLFDQAEDGEGHIVFVAAVNLAFGRVEARLVDATQHGRRDHLLFALVHFVELQHGTLARAEEFVQLQIFKVVEDAAVVEHRMQPPDQRAGGRIIFAVKAIFFVIALFTFGGLAHGVEQLLQGVDAPLKAALGKAIGAAQLVLHLLREVGQQIAQVGNREAVNAHAHIVGAEDTHLGLVVALAKGGDILHLLQSAIFAMRVDDHHRGAIVGHHQLFEQHAGQITFPAPRAGDNRQVGAGKTLDIERHRHGVGRTAEQAA